MMKTNTQLMLVSRWQPFSWSPVQEFQEEMRLVRERFAARNRPALADSYPPVNIWGDNDEVYAEAHQRQRCGKQPRNQERTADRIG